MCDDALLPHFINASLLDESQHGMEGAPHLERADALQILAFEKQPERWFRRFLARPLRVLQCCRRLGGGCEPAERRVRQDWRAVDVWLDELVGRFDRCAVQGGWRRMRGCICHGCTCCRRYAQDISVAWW
jgi:hypothetical protein